MDPLCSSTRLAPTDGILKWYRAFLRHKRRPETAGKDPRTLSRTDFILKPLNTNNSNNITSISRAQDPLLDLRSTKNTTYGGSWQHVPNPPPRKKMCLGLSLTIGREGAPRDSTPASEGTWAAGEQPAPEVVRVHLCFLWSTRV